MKIGIDISQIVYEGTGVSNYTRSLVEALVKASNNDEFVLFGSSLRIRRPLKEFLKNLQAKNVKGKFSYLPPKLLEFLWNGVHLFPVEYFVGEIDVFHSSDWLEPPTKNAKKITTIHDLTVFKYPETFSPTGGHDIVKNQKRKLFFAKRECDIIVCVSETTKQDVMEILKIPERKLRVVYEAPDPFYSPRSEDNIQKIKEKFNIGGDYLLCVGTREPRKNLERAIIAFAEISRVYADLTLIIAGKYGWGNDSSKFKVQSAKLESRVKILGYVEKEDLPALYSGAQAFIYPSLYEGFGLPILEAMACGCPVVTSNLGSMKEIAGEAAILVDPVSISGIANGIAKIVGDSKTRNRLINEGQRRNLEFSWEKTAFQTLDIYRSLAKE